MKCVFSTSQNNVIIYKIGTVHDAISEDSAVIHCYGNEAKLSQTIQRLNQLFDTPAMLPPDLIIRPSETI